MASLRRGRTLRRKLPCHGTDNIFANSKILAREGDLRQNFCELVDFASLEETCRELFLSTNNKHMKRSLAEGASGQHGEGGGTFLIPDLLPDSPQVLSSS